MKKYVMQDNKLLLEGAFVEEGKEIVASGNNLAVIKDGEMRYRLLAKKGDAYYDLGEPFLDFTLESLKKMCKGKWEMDTVVNAQIIKCIAKDPELVGVIPNSFYMNIPKFAEKLQCEYKSTVYAAYAECSADETEGFLKKTKEDMDKLTDYIKQQENGKNDLDKLFEDEKEALI